MRGGRTILAVVPARGGSKGIHRKNLREVGGLSLFAHAARLVQALSWLDGALLSTDDEEIAAEGERHGLEAPFRRPAELAGDNAGSIEMWQHAWREAEAIADATYDISILLEPTSPLRRPEDIEATVAPLIEDGRSAAVTVSRTPALFTPEKTLQIDDDNRLIPYLDQDRPTRQAIPPRISVREWPRAGRR